MLVLLSQNIHGVTAWEYYGILREHMKHFHLHADLTLILHVTEDKV